MDFSTCSDNDLIALFCGSIIELRNRGVIRTEDIVGEIGEYLIVNYYNKNPSLPNLSRVSSDIKNIKAISQNGKRYAIKPITENVVGGFEGLESPESKRKDKPLFEYLIIFRLDKEYDLEEVYQLDWECFNKHKKWNRCVNAWSLTITASLRKEATSIYDQYSEHHSDEHIAGKETEDSIHEDSGSYQSDDQQAPVVWKKVGSVEHNEVKQAVVNRLSQKYGLGFDRDTDSRYVSKDGEHALFVMSAKYSEKNAEYWYSINDENIPWLELYPECHIVFALGSENNILVFPFEELKELLEGCIKTKEDISKKKKAHYHISFAVQGENQVYFKRKLPHKTKEDVSRYLVRE